MILWITNGLIALGTFLKDYKMLPVHCFFNETKGQLPETAKQLTETKPLK